MLLKTTSKAFVAPVVATPCKQSVKASASAFVGAPLAKSTRSVPSVQAKRITVQVAASAMAASGLQAPHGNKLVNLMVSNKAEYKAKCKHTFECSDRNACDVELLSVGGFSPLEGFMNEADYNSVVKDMRLTNGLIFGLPIVYDTNSEDVQVGDWVLFTYKGQEIGAMQVESKWVPNKVLEAKHCYGSTSIEHPAVKMISMERGKYYLGGKVVGFELPVREFKCATPEQVRATLPAGKDVVAFQCRNPIHRAHYELFTRSLDNENVGKDGICLVHPTCGPTQDDDIPGLVRYRTYEVLKEEVNNPRIRWAYLPYSMHMAGPREAIQHMLIRKNYGCTHFIIGRDMAGCKSSLTGDDFYGAFDAQDFAKQHAPELGMKTVPSPNIVYTEEQGFISADVAKKEGLTIKNLSGTKFRQMLRSGEEIPSWFSFASVISVLREAQKE